jgi:hypothetical protein
MTAISVIIFPNLNLLEDGENGDRVDGGDE